MSGPVDGIADELPVATDPLAIRSAMLPSAIVVSAAAASVGVGVAGTA